MRLFQPWKIAHLRLFWFSRIFLFFWLDLTFLWFENNVRHFQRKLFENFSENFLHLLFIFHLQAKKVHHTTKNIFTDSDSAESDSDSDLFITKPVKDQNIPKVKSIFEGEHTTSGIPYTVGPLPTKEKQESKYQLPYNDSKEEVLLLIPFFNEIIRIYCSS